MLACEITKGDILSARTSGANAHDRVLGCIPMALWRQARSCAQQFKCSKSPESQRGGELAARCIHIRQCTKVYWTRASEKLSDHLWAVGCWFEPMGHAGFFAESYHHAQLLLLVSGGHLLWNVFLTCDMIGAKVAVSEIDTCTECDFHSNAGSVMLITCLAMLLCFCNASVCSETLACG